MGDHKSVPIALISHFNKIRITLTQPVKGESAKPATEKRWQTAKTITKYYHGIHYLQFELAEFSYGRIGKS